MMQDSDLKWNDVVQVGPETPGGRYLRCFWWPVAMAEEVKDIPVPVKVLGEELVLFRDLSGRLSLLGGRCAHRRAALEYGRIEEHGIRCAYHGWYYDCKGKIIDRPAEPIKAAPHIIHPWYPVQELGGLIFAYMGTDKGSPPPLPRFDILVNDGCRVAERGDARFGKAYNCNWLQGVENTTDTTHLTYLHNLSDRCPIFKPVETDYGVKLYILSNGSRPDRVRLRRRCTVLPTINRKSREPKADRPDRPQVSIQQAIWIVPMDDTHSEEMRLTLYPEPPKEKRYHGTYTDEARQRERKPYDRRFYGDIHGIIPLEDKAMVETQGPIVDRELEHPGYGDRAILLLRKMIRQGILDVANGRKPKGILENDCDMIDLDIGFEEFEPDRLPEIARDLLPELRQQMQTAR